MAYVGLQCTKMPTDGFVAMSLEPGNVTIQKTPITSPNLSLLVPFAMPANYQGQMTIQYWAGPTAPPLGASATPLVEILPAAGG
jgi:hypothetical protein